jgi:hypothetical protein
MYNANVIEVLVASPGDTHDQRETIRQAVIRWNSIESRHFGVVLLPVMWETHTYPNLGQPAQASINKQIVDDADLLIATFWTTLGTPTVNSRSGTVDEIERFIDDKKHVCLYFCDMPVVLLDQDTSDIDSLKAFRDEMKPKGLFSSYRSLDELSSKVRDDLTKLIHDLRESGDITDVEENALRVSTQAGVASRDVDDALSELQNSLRGYLAKWETTFGSLGDDYSADKRLSLASEIEGVLLEVIRVASTDAPGVPFVAELSQIATDAAAVARIRVYLDGGRSFGELTDGCQALLESIRNVLAQPWQRGEAS